MTGIATQVPIITTAEVADTMIMATGPITPTYLRITGDIHITDGIIHMPGPTVIHITVPTHGTTAITIIMTGTIRTVTDTATDRIIPDTGPVTTTDIMRPFTVRIIITTIRRTAFAMTIGRAALMLPGVVRSPQVPLHTEAGAALQAGQA